MTSLYILFGFFAACIGQQLRSICYYTNWAQYRYGPGQFFPEDTDPNLCTHIIYSFGRVTGLGIKAYEWNDDSTQWSAGMYERMMKVKAAHPGTKVLLAIGGWNMGTAPFTLIAASPQSRSSFAQNAISFLRQREFDGLDMDWEYPGSRGSPPVDKQNYIELMKELYSAFQIEASNSGKPPLLLTAATPAGKSNIDSGFDLAQLVPYVDFISLMTYDLHGGWEKTTGHNAPLYKHSKETGDDAHLNVAWAAQYYISQGFPAAKINLGIPTYGRSFTMDNPANHGVGVPAGRSGDKGRYTGENGFLAYYEVCEKINNGAKVYEIPSQHAKYVVDGSQWIGYDDVNAVKEKACYARQNGFGGIMFWALDLDDFQGSVCNQGRYPLISAAVNQMLAASTTSCQAPPVQPNPTPGPVIPLPTTQSPTSGNPIFPQTSGPQIQTTKNPYIVQTLGPYMFTLRPFNPNPTASPTIGPTGTNFVRTNSVDCSNMPDGMYGDPASCSHFITCHSQIAYRSECAPTLMFNVQKSYCDYPSNVICTQGAGPSNPGINGPVVTSAPRPAPNTTPVPTGIASNPCTPGVDFKRDPLICSRFVQCVYGQPIVVDCPTGLVFNEVSTHCDWPFNVPGC